MDKEKIIAGIVGGVVAGFSIGVGFLIAQRTMGRLASKKNKGDSDTVADAEKKGVAEGVKQAKTEEQAAQFAAMNAGRGRRRPAPRGGFMGFDGNESTFSGDPSSMSFSGDPTHFGSTPNGNLNSFS